MRVLELNTVKLRKIISGGQQGADQGGLLAAKALNVETGGQAAENYATVKGGTAPWLKELGLTAAGTFPQRTRVNIDAADATVVFASNFKSPGTKLTVNYATKRGKPVMCFSLSTRPDVAAELLQHFIKENQVRTLNIAGNRDDEERDGRHARFTFDVVSRALATLEANGDLETREKK
jgi:nucleoside 2-deoxyribosyltransferase